MKALGASAKTPGRVFLARGAKLLDLFNQIEDQLYRYPALSPRSFRQAVEAITNTPPLG
jgi:hypothetical protein